MDVLVWVAALMPVAVLIFYIYRKDRANSEPVKELLKAFGLGMLSILASLLVSVPFEMLGLYSMEPSSVIGAISVSFFGAAIPEELAKFFMLWLLLRKSKYFDEKVDGIVYAVCVSMGFAAVENVMYLFDNYDSWLQVGIMRALFSIPGNFCFGVLMGYYYSLARFYPKSPKKNRAMILLAPIIVHGLFDSILFVINVTPAISGLLMIVFLVFCFKMWRYCSKNIKTHLERDKEVV